MLPIDPYIPSIVGQVRAHRALVVTAAPGAGKTTRVPPALAVDGAVLVLQPRRIAARSIAQRIASDQGWTPGREVGWQVRFEKRFTAATRVLLATEGILTARAQADPLLSEFTTIVLDEFHERSLHADLGIALAKQAWLARTDLRLVVMSATLDTGPVAAYLGGCPVVDVPGAGHGVTVSYSPAITLVDAVQSMLRQTAGQVLCFLPGAAEIRRAAGDLQLQIRGAEIVQLHGSLSPAEQDAAIAGVAGRRVILATNIAETSLTVPGVAAVVDSGLQKVARYDPDRAIDSLVVERITQDAADQRAGRAGRLGPGLALRLWAAGDRLRPHREPDVRRVDVTGAVLEILAWGADPATFDWFERPPDEALASALALLERLGAARGPRVTPLGQRMAALPLHPRLARVMLESRGAWDAAVACALLSERQLQPRAAGAATSVTTTSDLLTLTDREPGLPPHVRRVAESVHRLVGQAAIALPEPDLRRALLAGYPDRVAKRRAEGSDRFLLATGHGAVLARESGVREAEYVIALDVMAGRRGAASEATIRLAVAIERMWLEPTRSEVIHELHAGSGRVRAVERRFYDALILDERPADTDPVQVAAILADAYLAQGRSVPDERLMRRLAFAGMGRSWDSLIRAAAAGCGALDEIDPAAQLSWADRRELDRLAPDTLTVPSGRAVTLDYQADGSIVAGVKLQELFGLAETPRVGPASAPVLFELRAPNGRAVQLTRDLRSFWERTYPEVRRELRARYPRHPWPEDPWTAVPTARTTRRKA